MAAKLIPTKTLTEQDDTAYALGKISKDELAKGKVEIPAPESKESKE